MSLITYRQYQDRLAESKKETQLTATRLLLRLFPALSKQFNGAVQLAGKELKEESLVEIQVALPRVFILSYSDNLGGTLVEEIEIEWPLMKEMFWQFLEQVEKAGWGVEGKELGVLLLLRAQYKKETVRACPCVVYSSHIERHENNNTQVETYMLVFVLTSPTEVA